MEKNNHNSNGFGNGFLLGCIVGAAVVFVLFTKKGKKLLKALTEEGIEGISGLEEFFVTGEEEGEVVGGKSKNGKSNISVSEVVEAVGDVVQNTEKKAVRAVSKIQKPVRRFFRNIPKRN